MTENYRANQIMFNGNLKQVDENIITEDNIEEQHRVIGAASGILNY